MKIIKTEKINLTRILIILLCCFTVLVGQDLKNLKKRVAVTEFSDKANYGHNIGSGIADMLVTALVESKKFIVIERNELDQILKEQGLGLSGSVTPQSAAKVGQLLGVELIITGSVSEFGTKKDKIGGGLSELSGFNLGVSSETARSVVDIRLVNTSTAEIITAKSAEGEESSKSLDNVGITGINFSNSSTWDKTILGKAARQSVNKCVDIIVDGMKKIPWQGKIIKANEDGTVFMKPGSDAGIVPGMQFWIFRPGEELIDPDTGISLGSEEIKIGKVEVISDVAGGKACKAVIKSGSAFQTGDLVRY
jgi:curli biogenesis system outer membrane secretion channel CsgG